MFIKRDLEKALERYIKFPVVAILGPRQSGKTTLAQNYFKKYIFISFENPSIREFAISDPTGFLKHYENQHGIILDEFQHVPQLLSYIQLDVDSHKRPGYFILTGSQNFLMNQAITQSLAGRVGILTLLPFSIKELKKNNILKNNIEEAVTIGNYPRVYTDQIESSDFYSSYINTYIERDVRQLTKVGDLNTFQKFLSLCAGRVGQELNLTELGSACAISATTAKAWISILQSSYIIFLLQPHFNNFNKRLTKSPKLYFYDTGIASTLLKINKENLQFSPFKGHILKNLIIADINKQFYNNGQTPSTYFWRDQNGRIEVDCIIDTGTKLIPIEIKSSQTISLEFFNAIEKWNEISKTTPQDNYIIYGGNEMQVRNKGNIIGWQSAENLINNL